MKKYKNNNNNKKNRKFNNSKTGVVKHILVRLAAVEMN